MKGFLKWQRPNPSINYPQTYGRREFIKLSALASAGLLAGCAVNPVTGKSQLMLVSEDWEIQVDRQNSPHQFSTDYGTLQDEALGRYIQQVGAGMIPHTHRPKMPYFFQGVNATYINAYAFPGGSIAATRGILLSLESEAALSALIGHELGHVNARHTAEQMSKGTLMQAIAGGINIYAGTKGRDLRPTGLYIRNAGFGGASGILQPG